MRRVAHYRDDRRLEQEVVPEAGYRLAIRMQRDGERADRSRHRLDRADLHRDLAGRRARTQNRHEETEQAAPVDEMPRRGAMSPLSRLNSRFGERAESTRYGGCAALRPANWCTAPLTASMRC